MSLVERLLRWNPRAKARKPVLSDQAKRSAFPVIPGTVIRLTISARSEEPSDRGVLLRFSYFDADGDRIAGPYAGMRHTRRHGHHTFARTTTEDQPSVIHLFVPPAAARLTVIARPWQPEGVDLAELVVSAVDPAAALADGNQDPGLLRMLLRQAYSHGEISTAAAIARCVYAVTGTASDRRAATRVAGMRRELDLDWAPAIPTGLRLAAPVRRNRICHLFKVTYPYENSGGAIRGLNLVNSLRGVGIDSIVITPLFYPQQAIPERRREIDGTIYYNLALPGAAEDTSPSDQRLGYDAWLTASIIAREAPAIIHAASGYRGYELALKALPIGARLGLPVIYEVRSFHEHLWGDAGRQDGEWTRLRMAQEERCMREAAHVVTISEAMRAALVDRGIPAERISVVPNAVGDAFLAPAPPAGPALRRSLGINDESVIGYVSNLSRREGHDVMLRAVARLTASGRNVRCLVVGDGPARDALEKLALKLGIADRTIFTGEVDHQAIRGYYEAIDVFVVPRIADYAADYVTPLKPFEALALGRPLIMSDRPVANEIVGEEERGLLFRTGDDEHLAATIEATLAAPEATAARADAGRRWIETERTWNRNAKAYHAVYEAVLDAHRRTNRE